METISASQVFGLRERWGHRITADMVMSTKGRREVIQQTSTVVGNPEIECVANPTETPMRKNCLSGLFIALLVGFAASAQGQSLPAGDAETLVETACTTCHAT